MPKFYSLQLLHIFFFFLELLSMDTAEVFKEER